MRISDWSSDVCSSDLPTARLPGARETVPVELELHNEPLPLSAPFRIAGHVFEAMPATVVTLRDGDYIGRGEAAGVYYNDDHPEAMLATLEALRPRIEAGIDRETLRTLLPAGGARNALRSEEHTSELQSLMRHPYS